MDNTGLLAAPARQAVGPIVVPGAPVSDAIPMVVGVLQRQVPQTGRVCQDVVMLVIFGLMSVFAFALGGHSAGTANFNLECPSTPPIDPPPLDSQYDLGYNASAAMYEPGYISPAALGERRRLAEAGPDIAKVIEDSWWVLAIMIVVAVLVGVVFIKLIQWFARTMTYIAAVIWPICMVCLGVWMLQSDAENMYGWGSCFAVAAIWLLFLVCCRRYLEQTAELLREASVCLQANTSLILTTVLLTLLTTVFCAVYVTCMVLAVYSMECAYDENDNGYRVISSLGRFKIGYTSFMWLWTAMTLVEVRVGHVGGAVGMWFFHHGDTSYAYPASPAFTALKWCFSSSFGSMATGGLILTIINIIKRALDNARSQSSGGARIVLCIIQCICTCILNVLEFITKFATITTVITGQTFWQSTKQTMSIFKQNGWSSGINAWNIDWIASMVIGMSGLAISAALGGITYGGVMLGDTKTNKQEVALIFACLAAFISFVVIHLLAGIILSIVDSLWLCFALDVHNGVQPAVHVQAIHTIYQAKAECCSAAHAKKEAKKTGQGAPTANYQGN